MSGVVASQRITAFRLNDLRVDPNTGVVSGPCGQVRLEPRVMAVLERLARNPGELVSRSDLLAEIWPGGTTYDEALTQCVYQLRQQLVSAGGDDCRRLVSTVPKRGYLLKGTVGPVAVAPGSADAPATETASMPALRKPRTWGAAAVLILLAAWAVSHWAVRDDPDPAAAQERTVAVLPFLPLVEAERDPVLELGMADSLITHLSGIPNLAVRPMSSVRWFSELDRDALDAGRQLDAEIVVDGSIQRSDEAVRVTVRLLRVADGAALWADTLNQPYAGIFALQDAISERIAAALSLTLGQRQRDDRSHGGTSNTEAYERYLSGRYHLARLTPADLLASVDHFEAAIALDPLYAQAWLGLANVLFRIPVAGEVPPREFFPRAKEAARKALEIDPALAEGHAMLGWIAFWYDWDWNGAETCFRRAIELNPNDTESRLGYAVLLSNTGRHEEALREARRGRELSPLYLVGAALEGGFLLRANRTGEAIQRLEETRTINPGFWLVRMNLAGAYFEAGRLEDALTEARAAARASGGSSWVMANEIGYLAALERLDEARALLADLEEGARERYVPPYNLAVAYRGIGDLDSAVAWLARAYEARDPTMTVLGEQKWQPLQDRPEYDDLMRRMGLARLSE